MLARGYLAAPILFITVLCVSSFSAFAVSWTSGGENSTNATLSFINSPSIPALQLTGGSGSSGFDDKQDWGHFPYLPMQNSEPHVLLINQWLLQKAIEQIFQEKKDENSAAVVDGLDQKPTQNNRPGNSEKDNQPAQASHHPKSGQEQSGGAQQGDDQEGAGSGDSVLNGITTPLLQRLLALDDSAFDTWQNLLSRRRQNPNFRFPELAPTFDALESTLKALADSEETSSDEQWVIQQALWDISQLRLNQFPYRDAVLLSRKLLYLIDFYHFVRLYKPYLDQFDLGDHINNRYFFLSPDHGVYLQAAFPNAAPWLARVVRLQNNNRALPAQENATGIRESRVYGIRTYPSQTNMVNLYFADLDVLLNTSWQGSPERLSDDPNVIVLPLVDPLSEAAFIRLSRFTVFPLGVSQLPIAEADGELMTPATFHEHDYEHIQLALGYADISRLEMMFHPINSAIANFERNLTGLPSPLERRLAVVILFHFLHEDNPNPAYNLLGLSEEALRFRVGEGVAKVKWQIKHGFYSDLDKITITDSAYENAISLILDTFNFQHSTEL